MKDVNTIEGSVAVIAGVGPSQEYSIEADWRMMDLMIAGLYSDRPRAVVRELCTNALDSHIDAGTPDRPFKVTVPTHWERIFTIRDYGISLTHEQVMTLYTRLGTSTKNDTNATVGKFGLGCKSPFAYTDSFTVTAYLNGEKRSYNALKGGSGQKPQMVPMGSEPTDEENGLEVSFSVRERDIGAFITATERVALGFDVLPECNIKLFRLTDFSAITTGPNWRMLRRDYDLGLTGFLVRQGCVLYPVDPAPLRVARPQDSEAIEALSGEVLILDMPIGSVDITPSRETLTYDPTTINNLLGSITGIYKDYVRKINEAIAASSTLWEASKLRNELLGQIASMALRNKIEKNLKWRGYDVLTEIHLGSRRLDTLKRHGVDIHKVNSEWKRGRRSRLNTLRGVSNIAFSPSQRYLFAYWSGSEAPKHLSLRLETVISDYHYNGEVLVLPNFVRGGFSEAALFASLGRPDKPLEFIDLETVVYEKPDYNKTLAKLAVWDSGGFSTNHTVDETTSDVFYVPTYRGEPFVTNSSGKRIKIAARDIYHTFCQFKRSSFIPDTSVLVAIPASRKDLTRNMPDDWTDFFEFATDIINDKLDLATAVRYLSLCKLNENTDVSRFLDFWFVMNTESGKIEDINSIALEAGLIVYDLDKRNYITNGKFHSTLLIIKQHLTCEGYLEEKENDYKKVVNELRNTYNTFKTSYPLIGYIFRPAQGFYRELRITKEDTDHIVEYINMRDVFLAKERAEAEARKAAEEQAELDANLARMDDDGGFIPPSFDFSNFVVDMECLGWYDACREAKVLKFDYSQAS